MSNLQPNCCLEFDFRKVDQHAGGKWLIHDTKRRKDNQLQSLKLPCRMLFENEFVHGLLIQETKQLIRVWKINCFT